MYGKNPGPAVVLSCLALLLAGASGCAGGSGGAGGPGGAPAGGPGGRGMHPGGGGWSPARMRRAHPFGHPGVSHTPPPTASNARVGALFSHDGDGDHFCTGSVVDSPGKSIVITAGHCINRRNEGGYKTDLAFVPGYRNGQAPEGTWTVRKLLVDAAWDKHDDPDDDVGFVVLNKLHGKNIQDVLGANRFGHDAGFGRGVLITGYPADADEPISCVNRTTKFGASQMKVDCTGYSGGTSGSPWLTNFDPATRTGEVIGVIGGYKGGGDSDDTSYSPYFGSAVKALYDKAVAAEGPG